MLNINLHTLGLTLGFLETMFAVNNCDFCVEARNFIAPDSIPHQSVSSICGVHACMNTFFLVCGDSSMPNTSEDVNDIRHWIGHLHHQNHASPEPRKNITKELKLEKTSINCFSLTSSDIIRNLKTLDQSSVFEAVRSYAYKSECL